MNFLGTKSAFLALLCLHAALPAGAASSNAVVALAKLQPKGGILRVAAPFSLQGPSLIADLRIKVGQSVDEGQALARTLHEP